MDLNDTPVNGSAAPTPLQGTPMFIASVLCLAGAMIASLMLVLAHFEAVELPGCGSVSDCTRAASGRWGSVPGTSWPLSFVGFAYFQALAAALLVGGGRLPSFLRGVLILSGVVSLPLVGVMLVEGYLCGYCLTIHICNLLLVVGYEVCAWRWPAKPTAHNGWRTIGWFTGTFALTSVLLAIVDRQSTPAAERATSAELQQALAGAAGSTDANDGVPARFAPGRYLLGPETARVHVTVVSDYQCPSCRRIDALVRAMTAGRDDVSLSVRHFPFCTDCNEHVERTGHPMACRAAIAAEAAGITGGAEAFWQMHDWLFDRGGQFTDDELLQFVGEAGIDEAIFRKALASDETLAKVRADADAADAAGLKFTPMVFINGRPIQLSD